MKRSYNRSISKIAIISSLILGLSGSAFAGSAPVVGSNELANTLSTVQQKQTFSYITQQLSQAGLPKSLALIPVIETHYNVKLVSNKGAGGLWQLMPATAKQYGVSVKNRFQVVPSTQAAVKYFGDLYKEFNGNLDLAVAAYNGGQGRVEKALKANPSATSVQQLNLPQETKQYVQKFDALQGQLQSYSM